MLVAGAGSDLSAYIHPAQTHVVRSAVASQSRRSRLRPGTVQQFKSLARELNTSRTCQTSCRSSNSSGQVETTEADSQNTASAKIHAQRIDFSQFEQPKVKMTYFYNASTDPDEHGSDQLVCQLKLAGQVHSDTLRRQAAQLVCHEKYHRFRNQRLEALVKWFHDKHKEVLGMKLMDRLKRQSHLSSSNTPLQNLGNLAALRVIDLVPLMAMAKVLIPDEAANILDKCNMEHMAPQAVRSMSEVDLTAQRREAAVSAATATSNAAEPNSSAPATSSTEAAAAGSLAAPSSPAVGPPQSAATGAKVTAGDDHSDSSSPAVSAANQDPGVTPTATGSAAMASAAKQDKAGPAAISQEQVDGLPAPVWKPRVNPRPDQNKSVQATTVALLDALISWSDTDREFRAHLTEQTEKGSENVQKMKRAAADCARLLDVKLEYKKWDQLMPADLAAVEQLMDNAAATNLSTREKLDLLLRGVPCSEYELSLQKRILWTWAELADKAAGTELRGTYSLNETVTPGGLDMHIGIECVVSGAGLPLMLAMVASPNFMEGLSSSPGSPFFEKREERVPALTATLLAQLCQLQHVDSFHISLPKDPLPDPPKTAPPSTDSAKEQAQSTGDAAADKDATGSPATAATGNGTQVTGKADAVLPATASAVSPGPSTSSTTVGHDAIKDGSTSVGTQRTSPSHPTQSPSTDSQSNEAKVGSAVSSESSTAIDNNRVVANATEMASDKKEAEGVAAVEGEEEEMSGSVTKSGFEFGGDGMQFKELIDALQQYMSSTERRSLQWIPANGPVRLQRWILPGKASGSRVWHNLQVSGSFRNDEDAEVALEQGPRTRYIKQIHLTGIADCLDEYLRKETGFMRLAQIPDVVRPRQRNLAVTVFKAVTMGLGYAALGIILAAPFLSAFRVNAGAAHRRKLVAAMPSHAMVIEAEQGQAQAQAQGDGSAEIAAAESTVDCQRVNAHLLAGELSTLCGKLQKDLRAPAQVRLGNPHADILGQPAAYQLVVDGSGEVYGCWPVNSAGVSLSSSLPATAQLRSAAYQQQYQAWLQQLSDAAEAGKSQEIAPPTVSAIVSKPAPEQPVVLRMTVLIDHASKMPVESESLGQLSISDSAQEADQLAELVSALESQGDPDGIATSNDAGAQKANKALGAKSKKDADIVAKTYVRPWTDSDSLLLWL